MAKVVIIWSGFGGLSAALYAAKAWHEVVVYEKNEQYWWRASVLKKDGFTRDMWPSWYLMPDLFASFFEEFGMKREELFAIEKLDPSYRVFFKDKNIVANVRQGIEENRELFESLEPWSTQRLYAYLEKAKYQYEVAMKEFVPKNYDSIRQFLNRRMMTEWTKLHVFENMKKYVSRYFSTPEMQKIMQYPLVFLWTAPKDAPALYNIMSWVDFGMGVWYPRGGIHAIIDALVNMWKNYGVTYHTHAEVNSICVDKGQANGIVVNNKYVTADRVISNADYHWTETKLLEPQWQSFPQTYRDKRTMAPSWFILYLGVKGKIDWLKHHTLLFSQDWDLNFDQIFDDKVAPTDPSFYICCPSKTDPSVAPAWHENLFILVPFPPWVILTQEQQQAYSNKILSTIEKTIGETFIDRIVVQEYFGVQHFQERYNAFQWSALWLAHTFRQTAIFRPNTKSKKVKGLLYAWWYTNPGIGMPMCLISGKLAVERIS